MEVLRDGDNCNICTSQCNLEVIIHEADNGITFRLIQVCHVSGESTILGRSSISLLFALRHGCELGANAESLKVHLISPNLEVTLHCIVLSIHYRHLELSC